MVVRKKQIGVHILVTEVLYIEHACLHAFAYTQLRVRSDHESPPLIARGWTTRHNDSDVI